MIEFHGKRFQKVALHLHTTRSDGRKTPEEVATIYQADGYDAVAFTDHWSFGAGGEIGGLTILSGCEYNIGTNNALSGVLHIVGICMEKDPQIPKDASRQEVIDAINSVGGIAVFAHPAWSMNTILDAKALTGTYHTEIYNAVSEVGQSNRPYSGEFVDSCANAGINFGLLATDDAHYYEGVDDRKGFVFVEEGDIKEGLKKGRYFASQGPLLAVEREGNTLRIFCTPAVVIATLSNMAWTANRVLRGKDLTYFEYEMKETESWIRVEVTDENGKKAWSNLFWRE